jgi:RNA polymerase sigma-70 factor (ECF subfamily)
MLIALQFQTFDGEFVQRLKEGDCAAGERFATYFSDVLLLKLRVRFRLPDLIEDAKQTTLLRVLQIVRGGERIRDPEKFGAFVNTVCEHVIQEHYRAELRYDPWDANTEDPIDPSIDLDAALVNEDMKSVIGEVLNALPTREQRILRAVFLDEIDKEIICRQYGITQVYLRVLQHRAKKRFRAICEERGLTASIKPRRRR